MIPPKGRKNMVAKMHRVHMPKVGEGVAHLPSGIPYEVDTEQKFPLGTYIRIGNKGFVYAKAGNTLNTDLGAKNTWSQKLGFSAIQANYDAGVTTITITSAVTMLLNELAGGEVCVFPAGMTNSFSRGIISNTAMTGEATLTLVLDSPTPVALTTGGNAEIMKNPYEDVMNEDNGWHTVMGIPTVVADDGEFLWLQVEGPCWVAPVAAGVGLATLYKTVTFASRGTIEDQVIKSQIAGTIICPSTTGGAQPAPFINLQIAH